MKEIAFSLNNAGRLPLRNGNSSLSALMTLGALTHTAQYSAQRSYEVHTDAEGLKSAREAADNAMAILIESVAVMGHFVTYSNLEEVERGQWNNFGWLMIGLADRLQDTQAASDVLSTATPMIATDAKAATP